MTGLRFGVNVRSVESSGGFRTYVQRAEALGFEVLAVPDHLGGPAPFATLTAAAMVTERMRLRTYVLNAGFWNGALLAREVATLDALSGGRAELGVGAGHMRSEHEDARLPWFAFAERVVAMERLMVEVRDRLAAPGHRPVPVQRPVPLVVGAMSPSGLEVAARLADVVAFAGAKQVPGQSPGTFTLATSDETRARIEEVRRLAGGRAYRSDVLLQIVETARDPAETAEELAAAVPLMSPTDVLDSPFVLLATDPWAAAAELRRRQETYGFDEVTTHQSNLEALGEVIAAYRADGP